MKTKIFKWLLAGACGLLAACAIITVNVYFPEKAAKEAYKSLDDMLLKNPSEISPTEEKQPVREDNSLEKPRSNLLRELPGFWLVSVAHAVESEADTLAVELAGMPEVNEAYRGMSQRLPRLNIMFDSGAIGLTNQGLITVRDKSKIAPQDEALVNAENQNRKTIISSMAKATLKLTKQAESALDQVLGKSAATYAETKRDAAKPGWWMQNENGRWLQK